MSEQTGSDNHWVPEAERLREAAGRLDDPLFASMREEQRRHLRNTRGIDRLYALLIMLGTGAVVGIFMGFEWCETPCEECNCGGWNPRLFAIGAAVGALVAAPGYRVLRARRAKRTWSG
ncbi:MAG: hypothetical protein GF331_21860 [Chitinivibrionales bacterium]|nr:hypothetical protein [Chitinivibrionales bacterium]